MPSSPQPYSLRLKEAERHFGFKVSTLRNWINYGRLIRGTHYIKVAGRVLILTEGFKQWMKEQDSGEEETDG